MLPTAGVKCLVGIHSDIFEEFPMAVTKKRFGEG